jgi:hypothetical protein
MTTAEGQSTPITTAPSAKTIKSVLDSYKDVGAVAGPRLFVLRPDGSGTEWIHERRVVPYLTRKLSDIQSEVHESVMTYEPDALSVTVMTKKRKTKTPFSQATSDGNDLVLVQRKVRLFNGIIYVQMIRHCIVDQELRGKVAEMLKRHAELQNSKELTSAAYHVEDAREQLEKEQAQHAIESVKKMLANVEQDEKKALQQQLETHVQECVVRSTFQTN